MTEKPKDRFGLPKLSVKQEVAVSFTLFILGNILVLSVLIPFSNVIDIMPSFLGLIMIATGYVFAIEAIRELEEEDHFLSRKLMKQE